MSTMALGTRRIEKSTDWLNRTIGMVDPLATREGMQSAGQLLCGQDTGDFGRSANGNTLVTRLEPRTMRGTHERRFPAR